MSEQNDVPAQGGAARITDAMVKAGAAAICCQSGKLGCAAKNEQSEFTSCVLSTFMQDSRRCLEAALAISTPAGCSAVTELEFMNWFIQAGCTGMSVSQTADAILQKFDVRPK